MLGRYQQRVGIYTAGDGGRGFDPKLPIFPSFLPSKYVSTAIGKWHLGLDEDFPKLKWHALNRGFSECYKFMGRGGHDYFELKVLRVMIMLQSTVIKRGLLVMNMRAT